MWFGPDIAMPSPPTRCRMSDRRAGYTGATFIARGMHWFGLRQYVGASGLDRPRRIICQSGEDDVDERLSISIQHCIGAGTLPRLSSICGATALAQGNCVRHVRAEPKGRMMDIQKVGVIGAGQMGNGIAHVFALAGYDVVMTDISRDALDKARALIETNLDRQVSREKISAEERDAAIGRISSTLVLAELGSCDLVIEAATERETVKAAIFEDLVPHLGPNTILTSNTSSISITRLASRTDRPEKFMGFHFMNPVPIMQLVELIRGIATDEETYQALKGVVEKLGKTSATAEDFPAFIVNRILMPMINEAVYTLYEGVGSVASIDSAMKLGTNHPMGPLELADFIGLDTCLAIMNVLHDGLADTKYRPCPLLTKYVEAGWLGRKTERGFYDYRGDTPVPTR